MKFDSGSHFLKYSIETYSPHNENDNLASAIIDESDSPSMTCVNTVTIKLRSQYTASWRERPVLPG